MPIGDFEFEILRCIAANRHPDSFVAGGTVLNRSEDTPRYSRDVDLFHDDPANLKAAAAADTETLRSAGYEVALTTTAELFIRAKVQRGELGTKIEWVSDSRRCSS